MDLVTQQQTVNSEYEDLLHQYTALVKSTEHSVAAISDKISADSVEQLTDLLHDSQVCHVICIPRCIRFTDVFLNSIDNMHRR